jgi:hypothetical protein
MACQWMREDGVHAQNYDLSTAAEIFANGIYFKNMLCNFHNETHLSTWKVSLQRMWRLDN